MKKLAVPMVVLGLAMIVAPAAADTAEIPAVKDNTLYESPDGSLSNGAGTRMFAGVTAQPAFRRALIAFDVAGNLPPGATVTSVTLTLEQVMTIAGVEPVSLHRVDQDWGEGASFAPGAQGAGGPAAPGDATWVHTFYDTEMWTTLGGVFSPTPSATRDIGGFGSYSWTSPGMVADVQVWLDNPASNFGWALLGNETSAVTAKTFSTREAASNNPVLVIEYEPSDGNSVPAVSSWGALALALVLLTLATVALRRRTAV